MRMILPFVLSAFAACAYAADPFAAVDPVKKSTPAKKHSTSAAAGGTQDSSQKPKAKKPARKDRER